MQNMLDMEIQCSQNLLCRALCQQIRTPIVLQCICVPGNILLGLSPLRSLRILTCFSVQHFNQRDTAKEIELRLIQYGPVLYSTFKALVNHIVTLILVNINGEVTP